jgi:predicted MPP superfamily phosphohydrolase
MKKNRRRLLLLLLLAVLACLILPGFISSLRIVRYEAFAPGLSRPIRIALVTDLHACAYGKGQRKLLDAVDQQAPDLILLGGDIFDDKLPDEKAAVFLREVSRKYPCFYVTGNHEYWSGEAGFREKMAALEACGVRRLSGEAVSVEVGGAAVNLCGVDDPDAWGSSRGYVEYTDGSFREQLARAAAQAENGRYTILLTHRPEKLELYASFGFDLVLAGHAHGGQWRIPGILNGLYAPDQGLFPPYAGGRYERDGTVMIVSRGLARESTRLPRFYNRPELVIVDLITA